MTLETGPPLPLGPPASTVVRDAFGLVGQCVAGKFQVEGVIGEGGYGVVYVAQHLMLKKPVALKCMKPLGTSAEDSKRATALFLREAEVLFSMTHPGIVRLYDVGTLTVGMHEEVPYAVLELVEGRSLEREIDQRAKENRPFTRQELEKIFLGTLEALAFTHAAGVAHRDLKPSNIMLVRGRDSSPGPSEDFRTKVLDFGVARFVASETKRSTTGMTGFTPAYAAPEQWTDGFGAPGPATDVFSMALTMAEACTLRTVMHAPTPAQIFGVVMARGRKVDIGQRSDLPSALQQVLDRALEVDPARRYPTAREMLTDVLSAFTTNTLARVNTIPPPGITQPSGSDRLVAMAPPFPPPGPDPNLETGPATHRMSDPSAAPPPIAPMPTMTPHGSYAPPPAGFQAQQTPLTTTAPMNRGGGVARWIVLGLAAFIAVSGVAAGLLLGRRAAAQSIASGAASAMPVTPAPSPPKASHVTFLAMPTGAQLSTDQLLGTVNSAKDDIARCHRAALADKGPGVVDVSLFVTITPAGAVLGVLDLDDLDPIASKDDRWIHRCAAGVAASWRFPSHDKDDLSGAVIKVRMRDGAPDATPLPEPEVTKYDSVWVKEKPREVYPKTVVTVKSYGRVKTLDYKDGVGVCVQYDKKIACRWVQLDSNGRTTFEETDKKTLEGRWGFGENDHEQGTWKLLPPGVAPEKPARAARPK